MPNDTPAKPDVADLPLPSPGPTGSGREQVPVPDESPEGAPSRTVDEMIDAAPRVEKEKPTT